MHCRKCQKSIRQEPVQIGEHYWHGECVREEVKRRAIHAGYTPEKAEAIAKLYHAPDPEEEVGGFRQGETFRWPFGMMLGVVCRARKQTICEACEQTINPGSLKGRIPYTRVIEGGREYGQVNVCIYCVAKKAVKLEK